jgi:type II secretory pathway component PulJ
MSTQNIKKYISKINSAKKLNFLRGYSLIEVIVYIAIFTSISILVINSFITILSSFKNTEANRRLLESGSLVMERMTREIRQANSIDLTNSTIGSNPGILQLNGKDSGGGLIYIKFKKEDNGEIDIYRNNNSGENLLSSQVLVTSLIFRRITTTESEAVKIEMTIQYTNGSIVKTENFYNTIILRGSY